MKATVRHDGGTRRTVELLRVVDAEHGEVYVRWPLGEVIAVEVSSGRLQPAPDQPAAIGGWSLIGDGLVRAQAMLTRRLAELRIPVANKAEQIRLERPKYLT